MLSVSGGLDSSVVAAAATAYGWKPHLITMATVDAAGDERHFARILSAHLGLSLYEQTDDLNRVRLSESCAVHLPRPTGRAFSQSLDHAVFSYAREKGACAYFHGGGGDNVFCMLNSILPAVDRLIAQGPSPSMLATIADVAALAQRGIPETAWRALQRIRTRDRTFSQRREAEYLAPDIGQSVEADHPWLHVPSDGLPGKALHIAWILGIQGFLEGHAHEREIDWYAPLLAQPVVETCLRIPTWAWCRRGRDRAVARDAFSDLLPAAIIERRSKGTPTSFLFELLEAHASEVRELLLDGRLGAAGVIDLRAVESALANRNLGSREVLRLMRLVDIEAWLSTRPRPRLV